LGATLIGSLGSVRASETIRLRHEDPTAVEVLDGQESNEYSLGFRKCCARLHDDLFLYQDMAETDYLNKMTENENCNYEKERAEHLKLRTDKLLEMCENIEMPEHKKVLIAR